MPNGVSLSGTLFGFSCLNVKSANDGLNTTAKPRHSHKKAKSTTMRKFLFFTAILLLTTACYRSELITDLHAPREGVVINGVRWATHNVAAPGEFTENPEDIGMFFQWNRRVGWEWRPDANDSLVLINSNEGTNWTAGNPAGTDWVVGNDPCPPGWRVPTLAELMSLRDAGSSWGTKNGVPGRLFGSASDRIFLPAAGWLSNGNADHNRGVHYDRGLLGFYWSRTTSGNNQARNLTFSNEIAGARTNARAHGYSIRCVREEVTGVTLNRIELVLSVGTAEPLVATIEPANATNRNVTWESSDPAVAAVNANGVVTAISLGTVTITVTTADGAKTAECTVNVIELDTSLDGVVINGTRWATRNVGAPGTFADSPQDVGMLFQWNRRAGWSATNPPVNSNGDWNSTIPTGTIWESHNDPCPAGWRVPTAEELDALRVGSIWMTYNDVNGRLFGGVTGGIFLPAAGWLNGGSDGALDDEGTLGFYWSRTGYGNNQARNLTFNNTIVEMRSNARVDGYSIRCVAE